MAICIAKSSQAFNCIYLIDSMTIIQFLCEITTCFAEWLVI